MKKTGDHTHTKDRGYIDRKTFLRYLLAISGGAAIGGMASCNEAKKITGGIVGAASGVGHLLRDPSKIPAPTKELTTDILIIGGGIAGLSAKRWLNRNGAKDVLLLEMDKATGGNSSYGENKVSAYPWAAHYLPLPDPDNKELIEFLVEHNIITGFSEEGIPVYNEYYLCHDPEERLYLNGHWQEGVIPQLGVPIAEQEQIQRFLAQMDKYKAAKGSDGKYAFFIPLDHSSGDESYRGLDKISFAQYLSENGYTSRYLLWYLEYCCKDDYGCDLAHTSAWAGIHYFAGRKGKAANAEPSALLTWPEGNGFLVKQLRKNNTDGTLCDQLVYKLEQGEVGVTAHVYDAVKKQSVRIKANKVIISTPQYITKRLLGDIAPERGVGSFQYAPWVVANITINGLPNQRGMKLCWDNVIYGTNSVGYVNANHQDIVTKNRKVISYYRPFTEASPSEERNKLHSATYEQLVDEILEELAKVHPGIKNYIEHVDLWMWGHGMVAPAPGFIWSEERINAGRSIGGKIFFAHSDLSGISIFEEAFYRGIWAAEEVLKV